MFYVERVFCTRQGGFWCYEAYYLIRISRSQQGPPLASAITNIMGCTSVCAVGGSQATRTEFEILQRSPKGGEAGRAIHRIKFFFFKKIYI